jgi:hypothetical protein
MVTIMVIVDALDTDRLRVCFAEVLNQLFRVSAAKDSVLNWDPLNLSRLRNSFRQHF